MIAIELTGAYDSVGATITLYLADQDFSTKPTDTPANTVFLPKLNDPGSLGVAAYSDGRTSGATVLEIGEIKVNNIDGYFDTWLNYDFAGRSVFLREGDPSQSYPAGWQLLYAGTVDAVVGDYGELILRFRDKQIIFDQPVLEARFLGNNSPPNGIEGLSNLKDVLKPMLFGIGLKISPVLVNESKLVYMIHNGKLASIDGVYDLGAPFTFGSDYPDSTALLAAGSLTSGFYYTCLAEGLFRLGSSPTGQVTCDAKEGATAADRTTAQVLKRLAIRAGIDQL